jgi:hypothetical protein
MIRLITCFVFGLVFASSAMLSQVEIDSCRDCPLPRHPGSGEDTKTSLIDVNLKDQQPTIYNVRSVMRDMKPEGKKLKQALRLKIQDGESCRDTLIFLRDVDRLSISGLGIGGQTLVIPVYPAREYYIDKEVGMPQSKFVELTGYMGYVGKDESARDIGVDNLVFGGDLTWSPFTIFDNYVNVGFSAGVIKPGDNLRIPVQAELRLHLMGKPKVETFYEYVPNPCQFAIEGDDPISPSKPYLKEYQTRERVDSTVYFYEDYKIIKKKWRPFVFLKGGPIFDTDFEGAGAEPSLNPEDYGQYQLSVGAGLPLFDYFVAKLSYNYTRLNMRTPCIACTQSFVVNTVDMHGIYLTLGLKLDY